MSSSEPLPNGSEEGAEKLRRKQRRELTSVDLREKAVSKGEESCRGEHERAS